MNQANGAITDYRDLLSHKEKGSSCANGPDRSIEGSKEVPGDLEKSR